MNPGKKKIKLTYLITTLLIIFILISLLMVWLYTRQISPLEVVKTWPMVAGQDPPEFLFTIGDSGDDRGELLEPLDVDVSANGNIYIADSGGSQVKVFNLSGKFLFKFGERGKGPGQFLAPVGIAVASKRIYVTDSVTMRVQEFDLQGKYLRDLLNTKLAKRIGALRPVGVDVDSADNIYLTDVFYQRVVKLSPAGEPLLYFGKPGKAAGQFLYPNDVTVDKQGNIYVSDSNNTRVQVFDAQGHFSQIYGPAGTLDIAFALNRGVDIDELNRLYVVDTFGNKVIAITPDTKKPGILFTFGEQDSGPGQLNYPNGIATYSSRILVTDRANNRVIIYGY
ncbi:MAG: 6-bladed beta-propeller [Clostridia bacterium]|nr:6-bladed beta-propeller [Clostridia bacterium]